MGLIGKGFETTRRIEARTKALGKGQYGRVLKMARKPTAKEYSRVILITGIGLLIIGAIGFAIYYVMGPGWADLQRLFGFT